MALGLSVACLTAGEASGESEGNDSNVFADSGVTRDCLREGRRTVREAVDSCDAERSSLSLSRELAIINALL